MNTPQHGDYRGTTRQETTYSDPQTWTNATTGEQIQMGPTVARTQSVNDRYCGVCREWKQAKGIMGALLCMDCHTGWREQVAA